jgi:gamma-glutamyl:cysteine ligase YbdK (ATP-grasp superfamily)
MGRDVPAIAISPADRRVYRAKVLGCLDTLALMLRDWPVETTERRVGLEVELNLVDGQAAPAPRNAEVLRLLRDPAWATELARFNVEVNIPPRRLGGQALAGLEDEVRDVLTSADQACRTAGCRMAMVGILPTLGELDVTGRAMSAVPRYQLLNEQIFAARGEEIRIVIDGTERLDTWLGTIMGESACTSLQLHLQVSPEEFGTYWNAAQSVAGVQVALAANSPFLFGRQLWHETRITLFEQATDTRPNELKVQGVRPRVWFGERWITSVFDLFEENLRYFPALLPLCDDEDPAAVLRNGGAPQLAELTLHNGTVYRWNRPVYAADDGLPHLRVENRVLPAGPTVADMMANAAFYYGLVRSLAEQERPVWTRMSFAAARDNLTEGARDGIDARLFWPGLGEVPVTELVLRHLLPLARRGLALWGADTKIADRLLGIIEQRCLTGLNGATWQAATVRALEETRGLDRAAALREMTLCYLEHMNSNEPAHTWPAM